MSEPVVRLTDLTRSFEQGGVRIDVLRGVNLTIMPGEIVALLGPSGTGKSTMLQAVGLLEGGFGGRIEIAGIDATALPSGDRTALRRNHLGFVYQFHHLLPDFSAEENVLLPQLVAGKPRAQATVRASELLGALGLEHRLTHRPSQLSGGEQQRVALARAFVNQPKILFADEPTGNLDAATSDRIVELLFELNSAAGTALVLVTHNLDLARQAGRIIQLKGGRMIEDQMVEPVTP